MKKLIISLVALMICACLIFTGCKSKENDDDTTQNENTTSTTQAVIITTTEPTSEVSTEATTAEDTTAESTTAASVPTTNKQPVKVTEPKVETVKPIDSYSWNGNGTYKCGNDSYCLVPGEYYIVRTGSEKCIVSLTDGNGYGISREIDNDTLATLKAGYTITVAGGKIIHSSKNHPSADYNGTYGNGIYKVGRDIPAGEYIASKNSSTQYAAGLTFRKTTDYFAKEALDMRTVDKPIYITLQAGEYVEIVGGTLKATTGKPISQVNSDGSYSSGMYKVGLDIPAGKYMLIPTGSSGMYNIYKDSLYNSDSIVKSGSGIKNTIEIRVEKGQYIEISGCKITPAVGGIEPDTQASTEASSEPSSTAAN